MPELTDVLVVGAGPAGSAAALHLVRMGHTVRLIDRFAFPRDKVCAEYLSPATVRELVALETAFPFGPQVGAAIDRTSVTSFDGSCLTGHFGAAPFQPGLALPRRVMDAALVAACREAGVKIEQMQMTELLREDNFVTGVTARDVTGDVQEFRARVIIGADGLRSLVARRTGMRRQGRLRRVAFSAHVRGVMDMQTMSEMHVGRQGYVGLNALSSELTNVSVVVPAAFAGAARGKAIEFFWDQIRSTPALRTRFEKTTIERDVLVTGPFDCSCRHSVGNGFMLVGDAADFFDPFTGDGIHAALVGARLAATTLHDALVTGNPVSAQHLAAYPRLRRQHFLGKWLIERLIGYAMLAPRLFDRAVARLDRRGMADVLIGATGHEVSPWKVLNPAFIARMIV